MKFTLLYIYRTCLYRFYRPALLSVLSKDSRITKNWLDTLKKELDMIVLTLKHIKLEIGDITKKYAMSTH